MIASRIELAPSRILFSFPWNPDMTGRNVREGYRSDIPKPDRTSDMFSATVRNAWFSPRIVPNNALEITAPDRLSTIRLRSTTVVVARRRSSTSLSTSCPLIQRKEWTRLVLRSSRVQILRSWRQWWP
ncbi:unnamed protein product [Linum trigynum]|uniref:Uncharacterized protein n=1 Tax=Linum trigynum TaxID=586398 RepID=A0AAV2G319_9ROSI